ncbi:Ribosomal protein S2 bacteria/mitochondria/plastid [Penicillium alfredii]|uniref:Ribosomal protein S2 bacteria/mitochondria/plastid n=1 Tax=Penicillium alfredii TaxID=1506179 RepID=A0A9W9JWJ1_9EURO|nr:Ribosomal protein S2 bacteria/mitochondria/plastid [Penicillium alfredii]KAJ5084464.1 Ribosomal protein S2 bacteria/mitochondria/plastid [Penicillium alfredii]
MILRKLGVRQSRQLFALSRRAPVSSRFLSTETSTETVQTHPEERAAKPENPLQEVLGTRVQRSTPEHQELGDWAQQRKNFHKLGSSVQETYNPEGLLRNPPKPSDITLEMLLAAGTHLGHSTSRWNPQNSRYIFGIREGVHIISLDVTAAYLRRAATVVEQVALAGGLILFVGTRKGQKRAIVKAAELAKGYHVFERWVPGSLTNAQQILAHCRRKVVNKFDEEMPEFVNDLADRPALRPDLVVCLNPTDNIPLLHECGLNTVPTVGIIDTDADPTRVTYPIPANDDSLRATTLIAGILGRAGGAGQQKRLQLARKNIVTYQYMSEEDLRADPLTGKTPEEVREERN